MSLAAPSHVAAQGWLADRQRAEGPGIRVGDLELHPGIGAEIGYDSNVFYEDQDPTDSAILRATAHLLLSTLGQQRMAEGEGRGDPEGEQRSIDFRGGLQASFYHFFIDEAQDNIEGDALLDLTINPAGTFSFRIYENFGRAIRPFTDPGPSGEISYARNNQIAGAEAAIRSRADILKLKLGYQLDYEFFDDDLFDYANNLEHRIAADVTFRFLPQTALLHETAFEIQTYPNAGDDPASLVSDNVRITSQVGLNGAFTNTLSAAILVGYSVGFYEEADDYESIVARVEGRWRPSPTSRFTIGYDRRFRPSFLGNFFREDRGYLNLEFLIGGAFLLGLEGGVGYYASGVTLDPAGMPLGTNTDRSGVRADASLFAEYRFTNWLGVNATLGYAADFTDYTFVDPGGGAVLPDAPAGYQKFEAWFGVRAFY